MKKFVVLAALATLVFSPAFEAGAASKKKAHSRADYSKAQQKKFFDEALKICRKKYGGHLHHVVVDYRKRQYVCWHY